MLNKEKYENKGLTGLANLGNTCYMNSCIQILSHIYELHDISNMYSNEKLSSKNGVFVEWKKLLTLMWSKNCKISPGAFLKTIQNESKKKKNSLFSGYDQNDACEFLIFILNCFHENLSSKVNISINGTIKNKRDTIAVKVYKRFKEIIENDYSDIVRLFNGLSVTLIKDYHDTKKICSVSADPFYSIQLPIYNIKGITLQECLKRYIQPEELKDDNAWYNEESKSKINVLKNTIFWSLPEILIIELMRFNYNGGKIHTIVDFPLENLDMKPYVIGYNSNNYIYDLFAVCNHSGNQFGGHYHSHIKNTNGKWYNFDDTDVNEISINKVVSSKSYCLFYRRRTN
tara:strand:+ start:914 stop:1942 length:1029 start_codon:yes stop_codon:yes gene_type:complete